MVATIGRPSIRATLASIECWEGDEILVVGGDPSFVAHDPRVRHFACEPGRDWGHSERNYATPFARGKYIAHIDDDDTYAPGTRQWMAEAIEAHPGQPVLFRMKYPNGGVLWSQPILCFGNVGTPMMLIPNEPEKLGTWGSFNGGDYLFLQSMKWPVESIVWRPEVIAILGHDA